MKKIFVFAAMLFTLASCEKENFSGSTMGEENFRAIVEKCCEEAHNYHLSLVADEWDCSESPCGWDFVRANLREKYESGAYMTTEELDQIVQDIIEKFPEYHDTLGEGDVFFCYEIMLHNRK